MATETKRDRVVKDSLTTATPWRIGFVNGSNLTIRAKDYNAAERAVYNRAGANKLPPVESISLIDESPESSRRKCVELFPAIAKATEQP